MIPLQQIIQAPLVHRLTSLRTFRDADGEVSTVAVAVCGELIEATGRGYHGMVLNDARVTCQECLWGKR